MTIQSSPGVIFKLKSEEFQNYTSKVPPGIGFIVTLCKQGPDNQLTLLTNQKELLDTFGLPNYFSEYGKNFSQGLYIANEFLKEGPYLYFLRAMPDNAGYSNLRLYSIEDGNDITIDFDYVDNTLNTTQQNLKTKLENETIGGGEPESDYPPPIIITQPVGGTIYEYDSFIFSIFAISNTLNLEYQWYFGTELIEDSTSSSYTISNAWLIDAGNYWCRVTNDVGSIDSNNAALIVLQRVYNNVMYYSGQAFYNEPALAKIDIDDGSVIWAANPSNDYIIRIYHLTIDHEEGVYCYDDNFLSLFKYDTDGNFTWSIPDPITDGSPSNNQPGIGICAKYGYIYYSMYDGSFSENSTIYKTDINHNILASYEWDESRLSITFGVDRDRNLYIGSDGGANFKKLDSNENLLWEKELNFGYGWYQVAGFEVDPEGNIYTFNYNYNDITVAKFDTDGNLIWTTEELVYDEDNFYFHDICIGPDRNVYIASSESSIGGQLFTGLKLSGIDGSLLQTYRATIEYPGFDGFYYCDSVAVDSDLNVYFAVYDDYNNVPRLYKFSNDGNLAYNSDLSSNFPNETIHTVSRVRILTTDDQIPTPPIIKTHPQSAEVYEGDSIEFSIEVLSFLPVTYQWYKGVNIIVGATEINYIIESVVQEDAGNYWCRVTNSAGYADSNQAELTIHPPLESFLVLSYETDPYLNIYEVRYRD